MSKPKIHPAGRVGNYAIYKNIDGFLWVMAWRNREQGLPLLTSNAKGFDAWSWLSCRIKTGKSASRQSFRLPALFRFPVPVLLPLVKPA